MNVPRALHHVGSAHGVHHVRPPARRTGFPAHQARGVDRRIDRHARLSQGFSHPWRNVARGSPKPRTSLLAEGLSVGRKGPLHRRCQPCGVLWPSAPGAVAGPVAGESQQWPTTCCKVEQGLSCVRLVKLVLNDKDGDRMAGLLDPVAKTADGLNPCVARLPCRPLTVGVFASRGVPLPPRTVMGIVGVHGQPSAAHASPPPT